MKTCPKSSQTGPGGSQSVPKVGSDGIGGAGRHPGSSLSLLSKFLSIHCVFVGFFPLLSVFVVFCCRCGNCSRSELFRVRFLVAFRFETAAMNSAFISISFPA